MVAGVDRVEAPSRSGKGKGHHVADNRDDFDAIEIVGQRCSKM